MKLNKLFAITLFPLLLSTQIVSAETVFTSGFSQAFDENDNSQELRAITITEDTTTPVIKEGYLDLTIPSDFPGIFDDEKVESEMILYGTAVDEGKVAERPEISFLDDDRTLRINIDQDFEAGDTLVISRLYVEGFYSETSSGHFIEFQVNDGEIFYDEQELTVTPTTTADRNVPEIPTSISLVNTSNGVELSWEDPTDKDLWLIQIYRGEQANVGVSVTYADILAGEEYLLDDDVEAGETYYYLFRASDGSNVSAFTEEVSITATLTDEAQEEPIEVVVEPIEEPTEVENTQEYPIEPENEPLVFTDEIPTWVQTAVDELSAAGVIQGNPDGSFGASNNLNRAEASALFYRILQVNGLDNPIEPTGDPFLDVDHSEWYAVYIYQLSLLDLIDGNPDGTYEPSEFINRAEFLQMAMNVYEYLDLSDEQYEPSNPYVDLDVSAWYAETIMEATARGFVEGSTCEEELCFNPGLEINRAEATQILYNMFGASL